MHESAAHDSHHGEPHPAELRTTAFRFEADAFEGRDEIAGSIFSFQRATHAALEVQPRNAPGVLFAPNPIVGIRSVAYTNIIPNAETMIFRASK